VGLLCISCEAGTRPAPTTRKTCSSMRFQDTRWWRGVVGVMVFSSPHKRKKNQKEVGRTTRKYSRSRSIARSPERQLPILSELSPLPALSSTMGATLPPSDASPPPPHLPGATAFEAKDAGVEHGSERPRRSDGGEAASIVL
jgi:hypothetical protein